MTPSERIYEYIKDKGTNPEVVVGSSFGAVAGILDELEARIKVLEEANHVAYYSEIAKQV